MTLASRIVVLRDGRIEQVGSPLDVYERPANRFVAAFFGSPSMNLIEGRLEAADRSGAGVAFPSGLRLRVAVDARRAVPGSAVTLGVRPEHLREGAGGDVLHATVAAVEHLGSESLVHARLPSGEMVSWRVAGSSAVKPGDAVNLGVDPARCHLFDPAGQAFPPIE
jgi:multiple sugar transport system ATP-binding protein